VSTPRLELIVDRRGNVWFCQVLGAGRLRRLRRVSAPERRLRGVLVLDGFNDELRLLRIEGHRYFSRLKTLNQSFFAVFPLLSAIISTFENGDWHFPGLLKRQAL
jgi:hypothetical protein